MAEAELLQRLTHPAILQLKDIYDTDEAFYIVTVSVPAAVVTCGPYRNTLQEYMTGGELFDRIVNKGAYEVHSALNFSQCCG